MPSSVTKYHAIARGIQGRDARLMAPRSLKAAIDRCLSINVALRQMRFEQVRKRSSGNRCRS
jgi:hypothetical protein